MTVTSADLARLRQAFHALDMFDREAVCRVVDGWPLATNPALRALLCADLEGLEQRDDLRAVLAGWAAYYDARYDAAGDQFAVAWEQDGGWRSWAALGLGKVHSDLGRWVDARGWLLIALSGARKLGDTYRIAECLGALGEVFLRAGNPRAAFELFTADAALLPPGSRHRLRLQNYTAAALGRLGSPDVAAHLLWESFFTAIPKDLVSAHYSLAGLVALSVRTHDHALFCRCEDVREQHLNRTKVDPLAAQMPLGFLLVGQAAWTRWASMGACSDTEADDRLADAGVVFGDRYPVERAWALELRRSGPSEERTHKAWHELSRRRPPPAPPLLGPSVVDRWAYDLPLSRDDPFEKLRRAAQVENDPWSSFSFFFL